MIRYFTLTEHSELVEGSRDEEADWIHITSPTDEEIERIVQTYQLPTDFVLDPLDRFEVPRDELLDPKDDQSTQLYLLLFPIEKSKKVDYREYETMPIAFVFVAGKLLTIASVEPPFIKELLESEESKQSLRSINDICYLLLWGLTNAYIHKLTQIDATISYMESNVVHSTKNESFYRLIAIHKNLVYFQTGITENDKVIRTLKETHKIKHKENQDLLHDILVNSRQAAIMVNESNQMIDHLSEVFSSVISNNLNNIMKFLTSLTIVLTIPTIFFSLWGMNVGLPLEDNPWAFWLIILLTVIISIITGYWLRNKDYL